MKTLLLLLLAPLCALSQSSGSIVNWVIVTSNSKLGPQGRSTVGDVCSNYNTGYVNALTGDQIVCKNPTPLVSATGIYTLASGAGGAPPVSQEPLNSPSGTFSTYSYVQGATGSVGRTQTSKNQDIVSAKDFAICDGTTDDTSKLNAALSNNSSVLIPNNTTCAINSSGLTMNDGNRLYGQSMTTSKLKLIGSWATTYDFAVNGRFTNVVVASNIGTVNLTWTHGLSVGSSVTIGGSATSPLNGSYTIATIPTPSSFTITTAGVSNGTYTDPTSVITAAGISQAAIKCISRDDGNPNTFCNYEVDHLTIDGSAVSSPLTFIDLTGARNGSVHDVLIKGPNVTTGQVGIVCADRAPNYGTKSCFFNNVYRMQVGPVETVLHYANRDGNANSNLFQTIQGFARISVDDSGSINNSMGGAFTNWYVASDSNALSYDFYFNTPGTALYSDFGTEGFAHTTSYAVNQMAFIPATTGLYVDFPHIRMNGGTSAPILEASTSQTLVPINYSVACTAANVAITLPATPLANALGSGGEIVYIASDGSSSHNCVINPNGKTINGSGSNYSMQPLTSMSLQWSVTGNTWRFLQAPSASISSAGNVAASNGYLLSSGLAAIATTATGDSGQAWSLEDSTATSLRQVKASSLYIAATSAGSRVGGFTPDGKLQCGHGSAGTCGVVTLASGTATVSTTAIAALAAAGGAGDSVSLVLQSCTTCGSLSVGTVTAGTSFVINSTSPSDASNVYWEIRHIN